MPRRPRLSRRRSHPRRRHKKIISLMCPPVARRTRLGVGSEAAGRSHWRSRSSRRRSPAVPLRPSRLPCDSKPSASRHHRHRPIDRHGTPARVLCPTPRPVISLASSCMYMYTVASPRLSVNAKSAFVVVISSLRSHMLCLHPFLRPFCSPPSHLFCTGLSFFLRSGRLSVLAGSSGPPRPASPSSRLGCLLPRNPRSPLYIHSPPSKLTYLTPSHFCFCFSHLRVHTTTSTHGSLVPASSSSSCMSSLGRTFAASPFVPLTLFTRTQSIPPSRTV